ncbi:MAG: alpha/beta hydrolase [Phycisphaeraceae bacterium]
MPQPLALWPNQAASEPNLTPCLLDDGKPHPLVLVLPGGGYGHLAPHEAEPVAQAFNAHGFHAAVLRYRLGPTHRHPLPLNDAQRAIRMIRARAAEWGVLDGRVAILGFSAGGHLASSATVHYDRFTAQDDDLVPAHSARPDAAILCYPVIDLEGKAAHTGSRRNLLGEQADAELVGRMSTHRHVNAQTPPTFLWHTADDGGVPVDNSLMFFSACRAHQVPAELHVYESGNHGLGLAPGQPYIATWVEHAAQFLHRHLSCSSPF